MQPFLTDLDPRAAIKGSRDPLGIQPIWIRFGRHVIGNLSNVSSSARDFTVLILGYYFAEKVAEIAGPGTELPTFLKWEQLAAYARAHVNRDLSFRGTERVKETLKEGTIVLSAETAYQILSNQKAYGIWGLYSWPGRASGLLDGQPARLTPAARKLVEEVYLERLASAGFDGGNRIIELLSKNREKLEPGRKSDQRVLEAVAGLLTNRFGAKEREFYRDHLLHGGPKDPTAGRQKLLAEIVATTLAKQQIRWTPSVVLALAKEAESRGESGQPLGHYLRRIEAAERVLAPASELFFYLLGCNDQKVEAVARRLQQKHGWGPKVTTVSSEATTDLKAELGADDSTEGERWLGIAQSMETGAYARLIGLLVEQNKTVMLRRGGAAWIEIERDVLRVRITDERGDLPSRDDLSDLWRFPYFLDALSNIATALIGRN